MKDLMKAAKKQGWRVEPTRSGHIRFTPPWKDKQQIICSSTPSDRNALRNALSQLKRNGLIWGGR